MTSLLLVCSMLGLGYRPSFLDISAYSRASSMGGALVGSAQDADGVFENPATPNRDEIEIAMTDWYAGARLSSAAGSYRVRPIVSVASLGIKYLNYGVMSRWDGQGNLLGIYSAYGLSGKLALSRRVNDKVAAGIGIGYVAEQLGGATSGSPTLDLGVRVHYSRFGAGFAVRAFAGPAIPFSKVLGAYAQPVPRLLLTLAAEHTTGFRLRGGAEYVLAPAVLRAGFDGRNICFGLGLNLTNMALDYAGVLDAKLGLRHQLTLRVELNDE